MDVFELILDDSENMGVTAISLVKRPAIEAKWVAMSAEERADKRAHFAVVDEDKRLIAGPAMIPDKLILREKDGEEYQVFFRAETIRTLSEQFFLNNNISSVTIEHEATVNGVSVVESWLVADPEKDKSASYGFNIPSGTWFVIMKVLDDELWSMVKEQIVEGFSVEGYFAHSLIETKKQTKMSKVDSYLEKIRAIFNEEPVEFASAEATDADGNAITLQYDGELVAGTPVFVEVEGEQTPAPDGVYVIGEEAITVAEGLITEVVAVEAPAEEGMSAEQMEQIVTAIATVLDTFSTDINAELDERFTAFKEELKKPATRQTKVTPVVKPVQMEAVGLGAHVRAQLNKK